MENSEKVVSKKKSVKFEEFGQAIAVLGESLGKALGQNLQDVYLKHNNC